MIDPELKAELERIEKKIDAAYAAANQSRQWMKRTTIETAVVILGPLFLIPFAISLLLSSYSSALNF